MAHDNRVRVQSLKVLRWKRCVDDEIPFAIRYCGVPERLDPKPSPVLRVNVLICILPGLESVESEVGSDDYELVREEVAKHNEEEQRYYDSGPSSERERCHIIREPVAERRFGGECNVELKVTCRRRRCDNDGRDG